MVTIEIPGTPYAKKRHRSAGRRTFNPPENVAYDRRVGMIAMQHFRAPITGPVKLTILCTFEPPQSWSKKKAAAHVGRYHTQKPDMDNLEKAVMDALNGIAYLDDKQVADKVARKVWGPVARTVVQIEALEAMCAETARA